MAHQSPRRSSLGSSRRSLAKFVLLRSYPSSPQSRRPAGAMSWATFACPTSPAPIADSGYGPAGGTHGVVAIAPAAPLVPPGVREAISSVLVALESGGWLQFAERGWGWVGRVSYWLTAYQGALPGAPCGMAAPAYSRLSEGIVLLEFFMMIHVAVCLNNEVNLMLRNQRCSGTHRTL